jgi:hypothetical protein
MHIEKLNKEQKELIIKILKLCNTINEKTNMNISFNFTMFNNIDLNLVFNKETRSKHNYEFEMYSTCIFKVEDLLQVYENLLYFSKNKFPKNYETFINVSFCNKLEF